MGQQLTYIADWHHTTGSPKLPILYGRHLQFMELVAHNSSLSYIRS